MAADETRRATLWASLRQALRRALDGHGRFAPFSMHGYRRAYERSRELLVHSLTSEQRDEWQRTGSFQVRGESGQRYRITSASAVNVDVLDERGMVRLRLCAAPAGLTSPAVMLAQKVMLERCEAQFLGVAVRHTAPLDAR